MNYIKTKQLAKILDCSEDFLKKDRKSRALGIPYHTYGKEILYAEEEVKAFLDTLKTE